MASTPRTSTTQEVKQMLLATHTTILTITGLSLLLSSLLVAIFWPNRKLMLMSFVISITLLLSGITCLSLAGRYSAPPSSGTIPPANVLPGPRQVLIEDTKYVCMPSKEIDRYLNLPP